MNVVLDGEHVVKLKPVFGYLHRNHEKIAENETYLGSMPYTDRLDYICSITNNWAYALAVENSPASRSRSAPNTSASSPASSPGCRTTPASSASCCRTWAPAEPP
jgi:hypothetical protein